MAASYELITRRCLLMVRACMMKICVMRPAVKISVCFTGSVPIPLPLLNGSREELSLRANQFFKAVYCHR